MAGARRLMGPDHTYSADWYDVFSDHVPAGQTDAEVAFVTRHLPRSSFPRILDLACGRGRHATRLAAAGYEILGVDSNLEAIALARQSRSPAAFRVHDMRHLTELAKEGAFDGVLCMWQSFGHLAEEENTRVLHAIASILRPGGRLVLDLYQWPAARRLPAEEAGARAGVHVATRRTWHGDRLRVELQYETEGTDAFEWRVYRTSEVRDLAAGAGLLEVVTCAWWDETRAPTDEDLRVQYVYERR